MLPTTFDLNIYYSITLVFMAYSNRILQEYPFSILQRQDECSSIWLNLIPIWWLDIASSDERWSIWIASWFTKYVCKSGGGLDAKRKRDRPLSEKSTHTVENNGFSSTTSWSNRTWSSIISFISLKNSSLDAARLIKYAWRNGKCEDLVPLQASYASIDQEHWVTYLK